MIFHPVIILRPSLTMFIDDRISVESRNNVLPTPPEKIKHEKCFNIVGLLICGGGYTYISFEIILPGGVVSEQRSRKEWFLMEDIIIICGTYFKNISSARYMKKKRLLRLWLFWCRLEFHCAMSREIINIIWGKKFFVANK